MTEINMNKWNAMVAVAEEYNKAVERDDGSDIGAMDNLIIAMTDYKAAVKNQNVIFVGDKDKQNSNGSHPIKTIKAVTITDFAKTDLY